MRVGDFRAGHPLTLLTRALAMFSLAGIEDDHKQDSLTALGSCCELWIILTPPLSQYLNGGFKELCPLAVWSVSTFQPREKTAFKPLYILAGGP